MIGVFVNCFFIVGFCFFDGIVCESWCFGEYRIVFYVEIVGGDVYDFD